MENRAVLEFFIIKSLKSFIPTLLNAAISPLLSYNKYRNTERFLMHKKEATLLIGNIVLWRIISLAIICF